MPQATVIDLAEFRRRREARRRQPAAAVQAAPWAPVIIWYPVQWVWLRPLANAASVTA